MKKIIYILISISAFSISYCVFKLRPLILPVSDCEVAQNIELYNNREVHIRTFLEIVGKNVGVDSRCINDDVSVLLRGKIKEEEFNQLQEAVLKNNSGLIEVTIVGTVKDLGNINLAGTITQQ